MQPTMLLPTLIFTLLFSIPLISVGAENTKNQLDPLLDMDIEDLLSMTVTSVSKKQQRLDEAAAAIFVITNDDIKRAGVTNIAEALRLAPGLQVAKMDGNKWAISSRGFNNQFANKLLVLMDGRSIYTSSFSGVYWEDQNTNLEDIDRIEVIRGPGATIWGANAVNGVINIITKSAHATQGGFVQITSGSEEKLIADLRYGTQLGDNIAARAYLSYTERDASYSSDLEERSNDDWQTLQGGFRVDGSLESGDWRLQGDTYSNNLNQLAGAIWLDPNEPANNPPDPASPYFISNVPDEIETEGHNVMGRWDGELSDTSTASLNLYLDHRKRQDVFLEQEQITADIDFQSLYSGIEGHELIWGAGYRQINEQYKSTFSIAVEDNITHLYSLFVQDEIELIANSLYLTLGTKLEHNSYTDYELQPSARFLWKLQPRMTLWGAISRAARTPSTVERLGSITTAIIPGFVPLHLTVNGDDTFESEKITALELGFRIQPSENTAFDLTVFNNQYHDIATYETAQSVTIPNPADPLAPDIVLPTELLFGNKMEVNSHGTELVFDWYVMQGWRLQSNYSFISINANKDSSSSDTSSDIPVEGSSPENQFSIRSSNSLSANTTLDMWMYFVDKLQATSYSQSQQEVVNNYTSFNFRFSWQPTNQLELSLIGHNLFDNRHTEFYGEQLVSDTEIERSVYGQVRLEF